MPVEHVLANLYRDLTSKSAVSRCSISATSCLLYSELIGIQQNTDSLIEMNKKKYIDKLYIILLPFSDILYIIHLIYIFCGSTKYCISCSSINLISQFFSKDCRFFLLKAVTY